jgi:Beta-propeller repeat/Abnormal spindle-like microcephaly-assoc'd, ASPM-SPD-2-Hydin
VKNGLTLAIAILLCLLIDTPKATGQTTQTFGKHYEFGRQLSFEPNLGQAERGAEFILHQPGLGARFQKKAVDLMVPSGQSVFALRMELHGARGVLIQGEGKRPGTTNYLKGSDPAGWKTGIANFARVRYRELYPGIDLVFYGRDGMLEHDFVLAPGAAPALIRLEMRGAKSVRVREHGDLLVEVAGGSLTFKKPYAYQEASSGRKEIQAAFKVQGERVGFTVGDYDAKLPLVIDPILTFSTYLAGSSGQDAVFGVATDATGNIYVTGRTASTDFPTHLPEQPSCSNCSGTFPISTDAFISKLDPTGTTLIYSTYLGGTGSDAGHAIAVDASGNALVAGGTFSTDFPSVNAITPATCCNGAVFVASLSASGAALNYSGVIGSAVLNEPNLFQLPADLVAIAADAAGNAYVSGVTDSSSFPITPGTLTTSVPASPARSLFISKVGPAGALVWSTVLPGTMTAGGLSMHNLGLAVDAGNNVFVTRAADKGLPTTSGVVGPAGPSAAGAFVGKINPTASALVYLTYLPGALNSSGIALDTDGNAYVAGVTSGTDLVASANAFQKTGKTGVEAYILKLNATGTAIPAATYFTGPNTTFAGQPAILFSFINGVVVDSNRNVYVNGVTETTLPLKFPFQPDPSSSSGYVSELNSDLSAVLFSTHLNGTDARTSFDANAFPSSMAVDPAGKLVMGGVTQSPVFPTVNALQATAASGGGYLVKIDTAVPAPSVCHDIAGTDFISVPINKTRTQRLNLTNCGNADLHVSSVSTSGPPFTATSGCAAVIPGATCSISIVFAPTVQTRFFGSLTVNDDAAIPSQAFPLEGTGSFAQPPSFAIEDAATGSTEIPVQTITAGATAIYNLSIVPDPGFSAAVSFTCGGAPPGGRCSVSPTSVSLTGPTNVVLSVTTTGSSAAAHVSNPPYAALFAAMIGLALILPGGRRRGRRHLVPICLALLLVFSVTSCGGGSGGGGGGPTPAGDYSITFTATGGAVATNVGIPLTVK